MQKPTRQAGSELQASCSCLSSNYDAHDPACRDTRKPHLSFSVPGPPPVLNRQPQTGGPSLSTRVRHTHVVIAVVHQHSQPCMQMQDCCVMAVYSPTLQPLILPVFTPVSCMQRQPCRVQETDILLCLPTHVLWRYTIVVHQLSPLFLPWTELTACVNRHCSKYPQCVFSNVSRTLCNVAQVVGNHAAQVMGIHDFAGALLHSTQESLNTILKQNCSSLLSKLLLYHLHHLAKPLRSYDPPGMGL